MARNATFATIAAAGLALAAFAPAQARTDSLPVGQCVNMGNTFESPTEAAWGGRPIADDDFRIIADAGFKTVRIPIRWDTHAAKDAPYTIDAAYMARIVHVVDLALAAKLNVIINSHHFADMYSDPEGTAPRFAGLWTQIAQTFADRPTAQLWFELENEPHDRFVNAVIKDVYAPALATIRKSNPDRPVIIGGQNWSGIDSLATLELPDDPNIVPTFHYYEPFDFTHQGADWVNPSPPLGRNYGTDADKARLKTDADKIRAYIKRTGKTPLMGESGAHTTVPTDQRVAYTKAIHDTFMPLGTGMCVWGFTNTFQFYDSKAKAWVPGTRGAMGLAEKP